MDPRLVSGRLCLERRIRSGHKPLYPIRRSASRSYHRRRLLRRRLGLLRISLQINSRLMLAHRVSNSPARVLTSAFPVESLPLLINSLRRRRRKCLTHLLRRMFKWPRLVGSCLISLVAANNLLPRHTPELINFKCHRPHLAVLPGQHKPISLPLIFMAQVQICRRSWAVLGAAICKRRSRKTRHSMRRLAAATSLSPQQQVVSAAIASLPLRLSRSSNQRRLNLVVERGARAEYFLA